MGESGADGLQKRFFGGEAGGEAFEAVGLGEAVSNFVSGEYSTEEAVAETGLGFPDAGNFGEIGADRKDHAFIVA